MAGFLKSSVRIAGATVITLIGLALLAMTLCHPMTPRVVVPVLRWHDTIYTGCAIGKDIHDLSMIVKACPSPEAVTEGDRAAALADVQLDTPSRNGTVVPLGEGHDLYLGGPAVYRFKGSNPSRRLLAYNSGEPVLMTRHPVSDARTLAQVLKADPFLTFDEHDPPGYLQVERLYAEAGRATIIEDPAQIGPIVQEALAAPVDWRAQTSGDAYTVTLILKNGTPARFTYFPAADLLIYRMAMEPTQREVIGIPVRAPSHFRDQLKAALR